MKTFWRWHCYGRNYDLWFVLSSHSACFLWAFVVVFNDSFITCDRGCITFTPLLSAVHLPLIEHLAHGSASIHFATQVSIPVLAAQMYHCWLRFSVTRSAHPALTWLHSWLPHVFIHRHHVRLLPGFSLILRGVVERSYIVSPCVENGDWLPLQLPFCHTLTTRDLEHVFKC